MCPRIGKNASSTLVEYFRKFDNNLIDEGHESVLGPGFESFVTGHFMAGRDHNKYYKFAFARNPYDRLVSAFYEFKKTEQFHDIKALVKKDKEIPLGKILEDFSSFVMMTKKYPHIHWKSQKEMIHDSRGNILVHYIGKVENIKLDLFNICNVVGIKNKDYFIPNARKSPNRRHYVEYYDDILRKEVERIYKNDSDFFGYCF